VSGGRGAGDTLGVARCEIGFELVEFGLCRTADLGILVARLVAEVVEVVGVDDLEHALLDLREVLGQRAHEVHGDALGARVGGTRRHAEHRNQSDGERLGETRRDHSIARLLAPHPRPTRATPGDDRRLR